MHAYCARPLRSHALTHNHAGPWARAGVFGSGDALDQLAQSVRDSDKESAAATVMQNLEDPSIAFLVDVLDTLLKQVRCARLQITLLR